MVRVLETIEKRECLENTRSTFNNPNASASEKESNRIMNMPLPYIKAGDVGAARAEFAKVLKDLNELKGMIEALPKYYTEHDIK